MRNNNKLIAKFENFIVNIQIPNTFFWEWKDIIKLGYVICNKFILNKILGKYLYLIGVSKFFDICVIVSKNL